MRATHLLVQRWRLSSVLDSCGAAGGEHAGDEQGLVHRRRAGASQPGPEQNAAFRKDYLPVYASSSVAQGVVQMIKHENFLPSVLPPILASGGGSERTEAELGRSPWFWLGGWGLDLEQGPHEKDWPAIPRLVAPCLPPLQILTPRRSPRLSCASPRRPRPRRSRTSSLNHLRQIPRRNAANALANASSPVGTPPASSSPRRNASLLHKLLCRNAEQFAEPGSSETFKRFNYTRSPGHVPRTSQKIGILPVKEKKNPGFWIPGKARANSRQTRAAGCGDHRRSSRHSLLWCALCRPRPHATGRRWMFKPASRQCG